MPLRLLAAEEADRPIPATAELWRGKIRIVVRWWPYVLSRYALLGRPWQVCGEPVREAVGRLLLQPSAGRRSLTEQATSEQFTVVALTSAIGRMKPVRKGWKADVRVGSNAARIIEQIWWQRGDKQPRQASDGAL